MKELALIMVAEATRDMPTRPVRSDPARRDGGGGDLRSGVPRPGPARRPRDARWRTRPAAKATVGFMGLFRDEETAQPIEYYVNLPRNLEDYLVLVLDPMLATAQPLGDPDEAEGRRGDLDLLPPRRRRRARRRAPHREHHDVRLYAAAVDPELDDVRFIVPGLGDAGDRLYGTLRESRRGHLRRARAPQARPSLVGRVLGA